jgi:pentatricopeptide repeat protein
LLENNITLNTALIDMYAKCGAINKAREVLDRLPFRDVVSWNALLAGYAESQGHESMDCFERMQIEGIFPNEVTFVCLLKACGNKIAIDEGRKIHDVIVQRGLLKGNFVLGNALVDMYAKCGMVEEAQHILEELPFRDIVSWSSLIAGYAQEGRGHKALACFEQMKREGLFPNEITFLCTLKACGNIGAIGKGKQIHDQVINRGMLEKNIALGNALVDMYGKCGVLLKAQEVLEELPMRDVVSWSSLIAGYAKHGQCHEALSCFEQMQKEGLSPDEIAFLSALNACTHSGKMNEAQTYYESMSKNYGMAPSVEHHTCIMVAFACSGNLEKAMSIVRTLPCSDHPQMWIALLNACTRWGNVSLGRIAFDEVMRLGTNLSAPYIIMAKMYAAAGMLDMAGEIEAMRIKHAN